MAALHGTKGGCQIRRDEADQFGNHHITPVVGIVGIVRGRWYVIVGGGVVIKMSDLTTGFNCLMLIIRYQWRVTLTLAVTVLVLVLVDPVLPPIPTFTFRSPRRSHSRQQIP